jgi:VanZ family protein
VLLVGALVSGGIETAQLFETERYTSVFDVVTNAAGAVVGSLLCGAIATRVHASSAVRSLALQLPLMGLVYLLVPLVWLIGLSSEGGTRQWLVVPVVVMAGGILGTVHAAYLAPARDRSLWWLVGAALAWYLVAVLPSGVRDRSVLVAGVALITGVAVLRSLAITRLRARAKSAPGGNGESRRFELPTLRLLMPCFAAYLALSSLWPLDAAVPDWYAGLALAPPHVVSNRAGVLVLLEHIAGFTLVGYIIVEFRGRAMLPYGAMIGQVMLWGGGISLLLELSRAWHPGYRASGATLLLTVAGCAFGGWLYHLQRDHVRALLGARDNGEQSRIAGKADLTRETAGLSHASRS